MLSERVQQLLTAAVDGELDYLERRAMQRLLRESKEARHFYRRLKRQSRKLRQLPRANLPSHFSSHVLQAVGANTATPSTLASVSKRADRFLPVWANIAAAAAVFLAISAGAYIVIALNDNDKTTTAQGDKPKSQPELIAAPTRMELPAPAVANNANPGGTTKPEQLAVLPHEMIAAPIPKPSIPEAVPLTGLFTPHGDPATVEPLALPPPLNVRELDQPQLRQRFLEALKKDDTFQLDLFCRDTGKGLERLNDVLRAQGVRTFVDAVAQDRLNRKLKTCYALYLDTLTPDEIARLFRALAIEDRKHEQQLEKLATLKLSSESYKALTILLGVEPKWLREKPRAAGDPLKPLTDATAEKLAQKLVEKSSGAAPTGKPGEHNVLVVACDPPRPNPGASKEISLFLAAHRDRKRGTVALLIVLRQP